MRFTMFGTGYVGLVTGSCFAEMGHEVLCVDVDAAKVADLERGIVPIFEPGLGALVRDNQAVGRLRFTTDAGQGIAHGEVIFIAVGTPSGEDGAADTGQILNVAETIGGAMTEPRIVVGKSTVPVGTADRVEDAIAGQLEARGLDIPFSVASNPEFLREGSAVQDFLNPDRIIIGCHDDEAREVLMRVYAPFDPEGDKILTTDARSAELSKYVANVMLATKISLMNEAAGLAERLGADIDAVRQGIGMDPRIGHRFIQAGCGYGGSCLPKDVRAFVHIGKAVGFETSLVREVEAVNERQKRVLVDKMLDYFGGTLKGKTVALWGLAFKPNTDDMREAPSRALIEGIVSSGGRVRAHDPKAADEARRIYHDCDEVAICDDRDAALDGADALIVVTEWDDYRAPDFEAIKARLSHPVIFDGRNLYDPNTLTHHGIAYVSIGRKAAMP